MPVAEANIHNARKLIGRNNGVLARRIGNIALNQHILPIRRRHVVVTRSKCNRRSANRSYTSWKLRLIFVPPTDAVKSIDLGLAL